MLSIALSILHVLVYTAKNQYRKFENKYSQKRNCVATDPISTSCVCERFIYCHDGSAYSAAEKYVNQFWEYINRSQTHKMWKLTLRLHNSQKYIDGIFVAVYLPHTKMIREKKYILLRNL
jgi:hypothetical protein